MIDSVPERLTVFQNNLQCSRKIERRSRSPYPRQRRLQFDFRSKYANSDTDCASEFGMNNIYKLTWHQIFDNLDLLEKNLEKDTFGISTNDIRNLFISYFGNIIGIDRFRSPPRLSIETFKNSVKNLYQNRQQRRQSYMNSSNTEDSIKLIRLKIPKI